MLPVITAVSVVYDAEECVSLACGTTRDNRRSVVMRARSLTAHVRPSVFVSVRACVGVRVVVCIITA